MCVAWGCHQPAAPKSRHALDGLEDVGWQYVFRIDGAQHFCTGKQNGTEAGCQIGSYFRLFASKSGVWIDKLQCMEVCDECCK